MTEHLRSSGDEQLSGREPSSDTSDLEEQFSPEIIKLVDELMACDFDIQAMYAVLDEYERKRREDPWERYIRQPPLGIARHMEKNHTPSTAPAYPERPKENGLLRSLGGRVLDCLRPNRQEDADAGTSTPQPLSESVNDVRSLEGEGDEAVVLESTDEVEEGSEMTITLPSKKQGHTKDTTTREPLKIRLVKKFLGTPWLPGEPLIYVDGGDRPTEGWTNVHPYIRKCFKDWKMTTPEVVAMTQENPFSIEFIGDDRDSSLRQDSNTSQEPVRHDQKT